MALQHLRSSTADKRPDPTAMADGQFAINTESNSPGVFFKDSAGGLVKVGPVHIGTTAPNATPAGESGNSAGEFWLDTTGGAAELKLYDGSGWTTVGLPIAGGALTGDVTLNAQSDLRFADSDSSNWVAFQAPATIASNVTWTLPSADGTANQVLQTDGSGTLSWSTAGASVTTSDTAPTTPVDGDLWYDSVGGRTYVYYNDGNTSQWVDTSPQSGSAPIADKIEEGNTTAEVIDTGSDGRFVVTTEGSERLRVDSSGRLGLGNSVPNALLEVSSGNRGSSGQGGAITVGGNVDSTGVSDNTRKVGFINVPHYANATGKMALIFGDCQASANVINIGGSQSNYTAATNISFYTAANSTTTAGTERMRITNGGYFKVSNDGTYGSSYTNQLSHYIHNSHVSDAVLRVNATNASFTGDGIICNATRSANSGYIFYTAFSGDYSDREFNLRGDGNAYADGSWNGGGADYAEYFEWSDSNPDAEDRRGISVVLDGDKIREAVAGEEPIGVISGNPSVVGDAAWNKWSGKYLRDDFGTYVRDENGERQLNPAYDPDVEYISREDRSEWDCVGLMGKLRIRKGQVTGARWIKMRDISDSVEEWLVR